ncbi:toprim domain-containing protein [Pedobacter paludis]|uniref:Molecular chaperone TorD n=1 Tax=Pedobacter paludis TaxID=2203212 RepID=A0A317F0J7_9SPHI|nr:toprim domain-containing protein [Pedobacter paludis]PWS32654.1 molecular chaperone TorD [Pedobacter paludis]
MATYIDASKLLSETSITDFLERLGYRPVKRSGNEHFYLSMLREERTASLCVNEGLSVWFDHGGPNASGIRGGNLIDLAISYWHPISYVDALYKIKKVMGNNVQLSDEISMKNQERKRLFIKLPNYKIEAIKPLGTNTAITSYLQNRGIWGMADGHIHELYYFVRDDKGVQKNFFAAGWQNENGGWEVRNKYFQGCLGHKGLSFIEGNEDELVIFEGYMDYLSWKYENEDCSPSVVVLNSLSLLPAGINRARKFEYIEAYFDRDKAGLKATLDFKEALPMAKDCSGIYSGFKDYNEKLMADLQHLRLGEKDFAGLCLGGNKVGGSR